MRHNFARAKEKTLALIDMPHQEQEKLWLNAMAWCERETRQTLRAFIDEFKIDNGIKFYIFYFCIELIGPRKLTKDFWYLNAITKFQKLEDEEQQFLDIFKPKFNHEIEFQVFVDFVEDVMNT